MHEFIALGSQYIVCSHCGLAYSVQGNLLTLVENSDKIPVCQATEGAARTLGYINEVPNH